MGDRRLVSTVEGHRGSAVDQQVEFVCCRQRTFSARRPNSVPCRPPQAGDAWPRRRHAGTDGGRRICGDIRETLLVPIRSSFATTPTGPAVSAASACSSIRRDHRHLRSVSAVSGARARVASAISRSSTQIACSFLAETGRLELPRAGRALAISNTGLKWWCAA